MWEPLDALRAQYHNTTQVGGLEAGPDGCRARRLGLGKDDDDGRIFLTYTTGWRPATKLGFHGHN